MRRRPPRATQGSASAASDVYKRQHLHGSLDEATGTVEHDTASSEQVPRLRGRLAPGNLERGNMRTMSARPMAMNRVPLLSIALLAVASIAASACSDDASTTSPTAHPLLECGGERSFTGNYDLAGPGFETAAAALDDRLSYYQGLYGGEIAELPENEGALQLDGSKGCLL